MPLHSHSVLSRTSFTRSIRSQLSSHLIDDSGANPDAFAIYTLADPRDVRLVRYVGMTDGPRRRLLQHVNAARLWLPDARPWWVKSPKLRPLYDWIRALHRDEGRLPVMVIASWVPTVAEARVRERAFIFECLTREFPLLNIEAEREHESGRMSLL